MFSTNDLIKVDDYFFTHLNDVPKNPKINKIATSSSGVSMMTIFDKAPLQKRHLLDKIIFDDFRLSLRTKLVTFYIKTILKVKNLIKGKF